MRVQYCSDLHLENPDNYNFIKENGIQPEGDVLILAGDTIELGSNNDSYKYFFDDISKKFEQVFMIPGNHEFYGGADPDAYNIPMKIKVRKNVSLVNNMSVVYKNTNFLFTTLWSMIQLRNEGMIKQMVPDFKFIKSKGKALTVVGYNSLFKRSLKFLEMAVDRNEAEKTVVVTHHMPTKLCNTKEFAANDELNDAFCVELHDFIYASGADYWVYGHSHRNRPPVQVNQTKLLTNQLGLVEHGEHNSFDPKATFDV